MRSVGVLLALLNTCAALRLGVGSSLKDSTLDPDAEDKEADDAEYKLELEAASKFVPSAQLLAAWEAASRKKLSGKQFARGQSMPAQCADQVVKWAQAPDRASPDPSFILSHPECADPWSGKESCGKPFEVPLYRLADVILYRTNRLPLFMKYFFPKSIGAKYVAATPQRENMAALNEIISGKEYDNFEKPAPDEVVVHVRLGDAQFHWRQFGIAYYNKAISDIQRQHLNISSATLVYGDHHMKQMQVLGGHEQSEKNAKKLQDTDAHIATIEKIFKDKGFKVVKRVNGNADCDVIYMANSKYLIKSGGGFSHLMESLVKTRGGKVL